MGEIFIAHSPKRVTVVTIVQVKKLELREVAVQWLSPGSLSRELLPLSSPGWFLLPFVFLTFRDGIWKDCSPELLYANANFRWFYR